MISERRAKLWLLLALLLGARAMAAAQIVAVDGFHNDETKMPDHYRWEGVRPGGFSELGKVIQSEGGELRTIRERIAGRVLHGVDVLIIVDPDTPAESDHPKYIEDPEIKAVTRWVHAGGRLVLLGNDKGNVEFAHLNRLAARFGIEFLEETYPRVADKAILRVRGEGSVFAGGLTCYLVEVAPLRLTGHARSVVEDHGVPIMALSAYGKGEVFAVGDPWVYNEYIDRDDNRKIAANLFHVLLKRE